MRKIFWHFALLLTFSLATECLQAQEITGARLLKTRSKDSVITVSDYFRKQWEQQQQNLTQPLRIVLYAKESAAVTGPVSWIASKQQQAVYHVKLKEWTSAYIGETEKQLQVLFEKAAAARACLFFDEADALFGKAKEEKEEGAGSPMVTSFFTAVKKYPYAVIISCSGENCGSAIQVKNFTILRVK